MPENFLSPRKIRGATEFEAARNKIARMLFDIFEQIKDKHLSELFDWEKIHMISRGPEQQNIKEFLSGAIRSNEEAGSDKPCRYDLISHIGYRRLAETYAEGAAKYNDNNWRKGIPCSNLINHAIAHLNAYLAGDNSEDHLAHAAWNLFAIMENEELRPKMNDLYFRQEKK